MDTVKKGFLALFLVAAGLGVDKVKVTTYEQLEAATQQNNDTLYVVNFWATWCKPCVQEMPYFTGSAKKNANHKVKVVFVSLNSVKELPKVEKFAAEKNIRQPVLLLNAGNPNVWIDKVDKSWGGSIPATVLYRKKEKVFFKEGEFTQAEIDSIINVKKQ
ncbi:MAG TPA: TlpA disulfide reductase family protein [Bacteroidia bacterium]|jgi:thiol-disulfide isomerase/thioredoxin|nr:TlpA disulfide reductase family protein [Bacteroidia bacterium]